MATAINRQLIVTNRMAKLSKEFTFDQPSSLLLSSGIGSGDAEFKIIEPDKTPEYPERVTLFVELVEKVTIACLKYALYNCSSSSAIMYVPSGRQYLIRYNNWALLKNKKIKK